VTARRLVIAAAVAWTLFVGALSLAQHRGLRTQMNDLGNADQAIWDASRGHLSMVQSNTADGRPRSRLAVHGNFIFLALSPVYRLLPRPELLLLLSVLACAAAGLGLYAFARQRFGESFWSAVPPLAFWASPMVHDAALYDFHVVTLVAALLVWCVVCFEARRPRAAWLLFALALLCNEDVPLLGVMLGAWLALQGRRREGAAAAFISVVYFVVLAGLLVPALNQGHGLEKLAGHGNRYAWLGEGAGGILEGALLHPLLVARHLLTWRSLRVPLYLLLSGGAAALGGWPLLLPALPQVLQGCLSDLAFNTRVTGTYYWIIAEAFIVLACAASGRRSSLGWLAGATAVFSVLLSPLPYGVGSSWANYAIGAGETVLEAAAREVPPGASLCAQNNLGAHFSQRRALHVPPLFCDTSQFAIFYLRDVGGPDSGLFVRSDPDYLLGMSAGTPPAPMPFQVTRALLLEPDWALLLQRDGLYLFARGGERRVPRPEGLNAYREDLNRYLETARINDRARLPWARLLTE
jgi:uncharacterized membrane protein